MKKNEDIHFTMRKNVRKVWPSLRGSGEALYHPNNQTWEHSVAGVAREARNGTDGSQSPRVWFPTAVEIVLQRFNLQRLVSDFKLSFWQCNVCNVATCRTSNYANKSWKIALKWMKSSHFQQPWLQWSTRCPTVMTAPTPELGHLSKRDVTCRINWRHQVNREPNSKWYLKMEHFNWIHIQIYPVGYLGTDFSFFLGWNQIELR